MCHAEGMVFSVKDSERHPIAYWHLLYSLRISSYNWLCCLKPRNSICVGDNARKLSTERLRVTYLIVNE